MVEEVECQSWGSIIAVDVGTRNPTAILTIRYVGDRYHIEREFYQRGLGAEDIINSVEDAYISANATFAVVDPSAAGHIQDMRNRGMTVRPADNDVIVGIQRVTTVLPTLTVDPSCVNTISEFESYQYSDKAARDVPIKANDHALDAFRYGIMELTAPSKAFAPIDGDVAAFFKRAGVRFR
jgi:phage terminase large subunit